MTPFSRECSSRVSFKSSEVQRVSPGVAASALPPAPRHHSRRSPRTSPSRRPLWPGDARGSVRQVRPRSLQSRRRALRLLPVSRPSSSRSAASPIAPAAAPMTAPTTIPGGPPTMPTPAPASAPAAPTSASRSRRSLVVFLLAVSLFVLASLFITASGSVAPSGRRRSFTRCSMQLHHHLRPSSLRGRRARDGAEGTGAQTGSPDQRAVGRSQERGVTRRCRASPSLRRGAATPASFASRSPSHSRIADGPPPHSRRSHLPVPMAQMGS